MGAPQVHLFPQTYVILACICVQIRCAESDRDTRRARSNYHFPESRIAQIARHSSYFPQPCLRSSVLCFFFLPFMRVRHMGFMHSDAKTELANHWHTCAMDRLLVRSMDAIVVGRVQYWTERRRHAVYINLLTTTQMPIQSRISQPTLIKNVRHNLPRPPTHDPPPNLHRTPRPHAHRKRPRPTNPQQPNDLDPPRQPRHPRRSQPRLLRAQSLRRHPRQRPTRSLRPPNPPQTPALHHRQKPLQHPAMPPLRPVRPPQQSQDPAPRSQHADVRRYR